MIVGRIATTALARPKPEKNKKNLPQFHGDNAVDNHRNKPPKPRQLGLATRRLFFKHHRGTAEHQDAHLSMREKSVLAKMNNK
jgi:hypothetical protein